MTSFSNDTLKSIVSKAYLAYVTNSNWVSVYNAISNAIIANPEEQKRAEPAALTWIKGAEDVNGGTGPLHVCAGIESASEWMLTREEDPTPPAPTARSPTRSWVSPLANTAAKPGARIVSSQSPYGCTVTRPHARKGS